MTNPMLGDAFAHHAWATEQLLDACGALSAEQLGTQIPGTYGSIIATLRHLVASDGWYLSFFRDATPQLDEKAEIGLDELRAAAARQAAAWPEVLREQRDPDADIIEHDNGWRIESPVGIRLAQVIHHGTDHRSQVCTALSSLGITPPGIEVWDYARASGRERGERVEPPTTD